MRIRISLIRFLPESEPEPEPEPVVVPLALRDPLVREAFGSDLAELVT